MDPDILRKLAQLAPTPLARLAERAQNDSSSIRQHHNTYYVFEMWLRLIGAIAAARYRRSKQSAAALEEALVPLTQPSVGAVLTFVQTFARAFPKDSIAELLRVPLHSEMLTGYRWACSNGGRSLHRDPTRGEFAQALASYRNKNIGHGAVNPPEFYRDGAAALFGSVGALVLQACEAIGGRMLAVEDVSETPDGRRVGLVFELAGSLRMRLPEPLDEVTLPELRSSGIYFEDVHAPALPLFPWLIWEDDFVQVLSAATKSKVEYLNYYTGKVTSHHAPHLASLRSFLQTAGDALPERIERGKRPGHWIGEYEILGVQGRGGMGTVYRARQDSTDMPVALKVLPEQLVGDPVALARFQREAHLLTRREHPNIVSVLDAGEADGVHYFAMELVSGCTLSELYAVLTNVPLDMKTKLTSGHLRGAITGILSDRVEPLSARGRPAIDGVGLARTVLATPSAGEELWKVLLLRFAEVADALAYLHSRGIIHRDIKPSNIMLTEGAESAVVMDLGIAKTRTGTVHTRTGTFVGTLRYASREQALRSLDALTHLSDLYCLGATMYELFTMTPLYAEDETTASAMSDGALLRKILDERPVPALRRNGGLKQEIGIVLEKLLEKQPERRFYTSAADVAEDLRNIHRQRPISAREYTPEERRAFELFDSLRAQAATWNAERRPSDLLWGEERHAELVARDVRGRFELSQLEREFFEATSLHAAELRRVREERETAERSLADEVDAKRAEAERQRRLARRIGTGALVVFLVGAILATRHELEVSRREADQAKAASGAADKALRAAVDGEAEQLLLKARQAERELRWDDALLFAAEVVRLEQDGGSGAAIQARQILEQESAVTLRPKRVWTGSVGSNIHALAFSPDGKWLAIVSDQPEVLVSPIRDGLTLAEKVPLKLGDPDGRAWSVAFAPDGSLLAIGEDDGSVEVWDARQWSRLSRWSGSGRTVRTVAFSADRRALFAGGDDGVRVWSLGEMSTLGHSSALVLGGADINSVGVSPNGRFAAIAGDVADIRILEGPRWTTSVTLKGHGSAVYALAFAGDTLLSGGDEDVVREWSLDRLGAPGPVSDGRVLCEHGKDVYALAATSDGSIVASGGEGNIVHLSDARLQHDVRVLAHYPDDVTSLAITKNGGTLAIGLEDGTVDIRTIERSRASSSSPFLGHTGGVENVAYWGGQLVSSGDDGRVLVWDLMKGNYVGEFSRPGISGALAARGGTMAAGANDGSILVRGLDGSHSELATGVPGILSVAISPDETLVAFGAKGGLMGVCSRARGGSCNTWRGHRNTVGGVRFSPDGSWLASVGDDPGVVLWRVADRGSSSSNGISRRDTTGITLADAGASYDVTFSNDGSLIATAQHDGRVFVWDARTRDLVQRLDSHEDRVWGVSFSPNGRLLASASKDSTVRVWDTSTWDTPRILRGHVADVYAVRFSPDGTTLASASEDRTIRLWDTTTWTERGAHGARFEGDGAAMLAHVTGETGLALRSGSPRYVRPR